MIIDKLVTLPDEPGQGLIPPASGMTPGNPAGPPVEPSSGNATDFPAETTAAEVTKVVIDPAHMQALGFKLRSQFTMNESFRYQKEIEWLQSLRQYDKIYDPEDIQKMDPKRSHVYPGITRSKVVSLRSKLHEICFPDIGRPWGIKPSPYSTISPQAMQKVMMELMEIQKAKALQDAQVSAQQNKQAFDPTQTIQVDPPTEDQVQLAITQYATEACDKMETEIAEQFVETDFTKKAKKAQFSGLLLGTGLIKGPLVEFRRENRWILQDGEYILSTKRVARPYLEFTRLWDWYPDMTVSEWGEAEGAFERHVMTKHEVRKLADREGFFAQIIYEYLLANGNGNCDFKNWEIQLQQISAYDGALRKGRKYEVLEYWGYIDAQDLRECGVSIPEEREDIEFAANVWILGNQVIKVQLSPLPAESLPWHLWYFEKDDSNIFGRGLARVIRDSQLTVCSAARACLDNAAVVSGPQIEVNTDLLDPLQDVEDVFPRKVWLRGGSGIESQYPALRVYNMDSHLAEYINIMKQFMDFGDLETAFPTYMLIEPQSAGNETAQGASIRSGSTNITVKDIAGDWDEFMSGILDGMYKWNMEFNDREDIKGDFTIEAKGLSSLISKEVRANMLQQTNTSFTDEQKTWIKDEKLLKEVWKAHDMPLDILRTPEEHDAYVQSQTDPRVIEGQVQELLAKVDKMRSQSLAQVSRAKETNIKAQILQSGGEV